MKTFFFSTALISLFALHTPAYAANDAELEATVKQLQAQVDSLQAQIKALKPLVEKQQALREQTLPPAGKQGLGKLEPASNYAAEMKGVKEVKPCKGNGCDVIVSLKPGPVFETRDGSKSFGINGFVQGDAAWFQDDVADHPNGTTLRRMRASVKGSFDDFAYKLETDFADNATRITDAFVDYKGFNPITLRAGQFKEPFSLEELNSDRFTTFIERAAPNALAPSRNIGVTAASAGEQWTLTAGVFGASTADASSDDESNAVTARATYAPVAEEGRVVHLGVAGSYRQPDSATDALRYRSRMETRIADLQSVDTGSITDVDHASLLGFEAATVWDWFSLQGEYMQSDVSRQTLPNATLHGYYVLASAFLTGEFRVYKKEEGVFDRITPRNPFNPWTGNWGAWEVAARYSNLDLTDSNITGGEMDNYTIGLNWYPHANFRMMTDYIIVNTDSNAVTPNDDPRVFAVRGQVDF